MQTHAPTLQAGLPLDRNAIARRIPHQGSMCLLARVVACDAHSIRCEADSHRAADNPLRHAGTLATVIGIEYAAQAMAMHGALLAEEEDGKTDRPRAGYLASVRGVSVHRDRLDDLPGPLSVSAERISGDANCVLYSFRLEAGGHAVLEGRATVMLDADKSSNALPESKKE